MKQGTAKTSNEGWPWLSEMRWAMKQNRIEQPIEKTSTRASKILVLATQTLRNTRCDGNSLSFSIRRATGSTGVWDLGDSALSI